MLPSSPAHGTQFFPRSATEFVNFDPRSGESTNLTFKPGEKGAGFSVNLGPTSGAVASSSTTETAVVAKMPDTPAGRVAAAYLRAFNSGDEKAMREFFLNHLSKSSRAANGRTSQDLSPNAGRFG